MSKWIRTATRLVNLSNVTMIWPQGDTLSAAVIMDGRTTHLVLTDFTGAASEKLAQLALNHLWADLKAGIAWIDMDNVIAAARASLVAEQEETNG